MTTPLTAIILTVGLATYFFIGVIVGVWTHREYRDSLATTSSVMFWPLALIIAAGVRVGDQLFPDGYLAREKAKLKRDPLPRATAKKP